MAGTSLLALLDDITSVLDDVAAVTKAAAHQTVGVVGDDLALNAQQVAGVRADRELPVVWAVAKGSLINKAILVPAALAISATAPAAIGPLLMLGGAYLCFEGFEKIVHAREHRGPPARSEPRRHVEASTPGAALASLENTRIRGAVRTDFVLSAEIVTIALGSVRDSAFLVQVLALSAIGIVMTVGVYGFVAAIVKLDDLGVHLANRGSRSPPALLDRVMSAAGNSMLSVAPWSMRALSVLGTGAMFLVGGQILLHGLPWIGGAIHGFITATLSWSSLFGGAFSTVASAGLGIVAGMMVWFAVRSARKLLRTNATSDGTR